MRKDLVSETGEILGSSTYLRDAVGQAIEERVFDEDEIVKQLFIREFSEYGQVISLSEYSADSTDATNLARKRIWIYNELGQPVETVVLESNASPIRYIRKFDEWGRTIHESADRGNDGSIDTSVYIQQFDIFNNGIRYFDDRNLSGIFDEGDVINIREYDAVFTNRVVKSATYNDEALSSLKENYIFELDKFGNYTVAIRDANGDGKFDQLQFRGFGGSSSNHTENITLWDEATFSERATISRITLTTTNIESTVVLDKTSLAKFTAENIFIYDGSSNDKVVLLNGNKDFTKAQDNTVSSGKTYDVYTTSDGKALWIQDGITVDLDSTSVI